MDPRLKAAITVLAQNTKQGSAQTLIKEANVLMHQIYLDRSCEVISRTFTWSQKP